MNHLVTVSTIYSVKSVIRQVDISGAKQIHAPEISASNNSVLSYRN